MKYEITKDMVILSWLFVLAVFFIFISLYQ